ncbi:MAG: S-layer homology domain-containing protein [Clostridia bacterium]|nr:S-layer homology domain-containing protein [Clostridia bacterium]
MKKTLAFLLCLVWLVTVLGAMSISADSTADFHEMDKSTLDKYMNEALALKNDIINSPTTATWTGTAYYLSATGNDSADGLTPATAWKSISKLSGADFLKEGDAVLFKCGDSFRITSAFQTVEGVTYSAYGTGAKPKIIGSIDASAKSLWLETEYEDVYKYAKTLTFKYQDIGNIAFDMGRAWGIKLQNYLDNGTVSNGLTTFASGGHSVTNPGDIKNDLEFWHDRENNAFYLKSVGGHPSERFASIEMADAGNGFSGKASKVTIDNLAFSGFGGHAIGYGGIGDDAPDGLTVQYCTFDFIGGVVQDRSQIVNTGRLGNAVEIYGGATNYTIHHCYAQNVYDCCWTVQYQSDSNGVDVWFENIEMYKNVACYSNTGLEVWLVNHEKYQNDATYGIKNMHLYDNYTYYNGYGWSWQRPNKDSNIFYGDPTLSVMNVYENNSVDNNVGMFARLWVNHLRYPGKDFYNFNNNVYFQHENLYIGGVPENADTAEGDSFTKKPFDKATLDALTAKGFEPGTKYYAADADYAIPEYEPENIMVFDDVNDHWGYTNIEAAVMRGYMSGISQLEFAPNASMTRAMLATVLMRICYEGGELETAPYTDVNKNAWYINAVNWAYTNGLVDKSLTTFRPDEAATREEMADMLYRLTRKQLKTKDYSGTTFTFSDAASVTPAYAAGIAFATDNGIIAGYTDGSVKPKNTATRAEVTTMIRRYVDKFAGVEADYSNIGKETETVVFDADAISAMSVPANGDKRVVTENGQKYLKLVPASIMYSHPSLTLYERFAKIDFSDYPYAKIRYKTTSTGATAWIQYIKNVSGSMASYKTVTDEWNTTIISVYDSLDSASIAANKSENGQLVFSPWGGTGTRPMYNVDECAIEYIAFFATKAEAEAYKSEFEKNSIKVIFMLGNEVYSEALVMKGNALVYPTEAPSKIGYKFDGWDVAEGTAVNSDMTVNAVMTKQAGAPVAYFNTENTSPQYGDMWVETKSESGINFYRFHPSVAKSGDNTRAYIVFGDADYDAAEAPVVKVGYRAKNISSNIDFNLKHTANGRLWGPVLPYSAKGKWVEQIIDLSSINWTGGEGVDAGLSAKVYFESYIKDELYAFIFKPYIGQMTIGDGDYFDIAYIAFFTSVEEAKLFDGGLEKLNPVDSEVVEEAVSNTPGIDTETVIKQSESKPVIDHDGSPVYFDISKLSINAPQMVVKEMEENGIKYFNITPALGTTVSNDNTRINVIFGESVDFDVSRNKIVKIGYRVKNISETLDFNPRPTQTSRLWGPWIKYEAKEKWVDQIIDLSKLNWIGGEDVEQGLSAEKYFDNYFVGKPYSFVLKPYTGNGITINSSDYFDLAYIAFFESVKDAENYKG